MVEGHHHYQVNRCHPTPPWFMLPRPTSHVPHPMSSAIAGADASKRKAYPSHFPPCQLPGSPGSVLTPILLRINIICYCLAHHNHSFIIDKGNFPRDKIRCSVSLSSLTQSNIRSNGSKYFMAFPLIRSRDATLPSLGTIHRLQTSPFTGLEEELATCLHIANLST